MVFGRFSFGLVFGRYANPDADFFGFHTGVGLSAKLRPSVLPCNETGKFNVCGTQVLNMKKPDEFHPAESSACVFLNDDSIFCQRYLNHVACCKTVMFEILSAEFDQWICDRLFLSGRNTVELDGHFRLYF
jgi:hypothetical protein